MPQSRFVFLAVPGPVAGRPSTVGWLLVSANNRPLGRSLSQYADLAACRNEALAIQRGHERLAGVTVAVRDTARWTWQVRLDGLVVAESSRPYLRMRECRYNLDRFLAAVPVAGIMPGVRLPGHSVRPAARDDEIRSAFTNSPSARRSALPG